VPERVGRALAALGLGLLPVLGGAVWWRLERDQPLWRRPALWAPAPPRAAPTALPRLVLAFHYPWYGTPAGPAGRWRHWRHPVLAGPQGRVVGERDPRRALEPGRPELASTHYPTGGPYDSLEPGVIRAQLEAARAAGLDGFAVSWWGRESAEARAFAALLRAARDGPLALAPYYEAGELWRRGGPGVAADLESLLGGLGDEPAWLRVEGAPVVLVYGAHRLGRDAWEYVVRRLAAGPRRPFLVVDAPSAAWLARQPAWLHRFDGLHIYTPIGPLARGRDLDTVYRDLAAAARAAGRPFMAAVSPGFDDRVIRQPGTLVPRGAGATYAATWRSALAVDPAWVLVSSWNEWHEGSEIEESREHGRAYLDATREWAARFRAGR
jgi:hypothetical protein